MSTRGKLSDDEFLSAFLACTLPAADFDHRGHLRIAWIHLQRYPLDEAIRRTCEAINRFATHHGATGKFHHTLSEALMRLMAAHGAADPALPWDAFVAANPALCGDGRALVADYYSADLLATPAARLRFLPPDRRPLP